MDDDLQESKFPGSFFFDDLLFFLFCAKKKILKIDEHKLVRKEIQISLSKFLKGNINIKECKFSYSFLLFMFAFEMDMIKEGRTRIMLTEFAEDYLKSTEESRFFKVFSRFYFNSKWSYVFLQNEDPIVPVLNFIQEKQLQITEYLLTKNGEQTSVSVMAHEIFYLFGKVKFCEDEEKNYSLIKSAIAIFFQIFLFFAFIKTEDGKAFNIDSKVYFTDFGMNALDKIKLILSMIFSDEENNDDEE